MLSKEFWQRLLATEAPADRLWTVIKAARADFLDQDDPSTWPGLRPVEVTRAVSAIFDPELAGQVIELSESLPPVFAAGNIESLKKPLIGIVGTRRVSSYGKTVCALFAGAFARSGCAVVSGGAIGIDSVAHQTTMEVGGQTVCVLPSGLDVPSPARHRDLFESIKQRGCLLSQFAFGSPVQDHRLIARNHFVANICLALVIIEAPDSSGSLITARAAQSVGKPVFVVPGPVTQDTFKGSHTLIREGATLVDDPSQVLGALGLEAGEFGGSDAASLVGDDLAVFEALGGLSKSPEQIGHEADLPASIVLTSLTLLEIEGLAVRTSDGYSRKR